MSDTSYKTAIHRTKMSAPAEYINNKQLIIGKSLDFGCGLGKDADLLGIDKFDPHYFNISTSGPYDTILCTYVLNVITPSLERKVLKSIQELLSDTGTAYITVRRDITQDTYTKKGTFQRLVILDLPILKQTSGYCIYKLQKKSE